LIIFFISKCKDVREDVRASSTMYDFTFMRDWEGVNVMNFHCGYKASATISHPFESCQLNRYWITHVNICGFFNLILIFCGSQRDHAYY
jgi:hypothetical protein